MLRRCAAKLQSVVAMLTSKVIFYMASNFYKNKILNFLFNEIVSVAFTFSLLIFPIQFPMSRSIFLNRVLAPKWPRNLRSLAASEHFGTNYLDIVVLLTRAHIWKTSSINWKVTHNWAGPAGLGWTWSLTILILVLTLTECRVDRSQVKSINIIIGKISA